MALNNQFHAWAAESTGSNSLYPSDGLGQPWAYSEEENAPTLHFHQAHVRLLLPTAPPRLVE
jgi:hypothetical protein